MNNSQISSDINALFDNTDPDIVWKKATDVIARINPAYDYTLIRSVFVDVLRVFRGEYPGYGAIRTLYHDLSHTLEVFLCAVRLMHGVHISGTPLNDDDLTRIMIAMLMHDIGYVQRQGEESGTGAQFTQTHVRRGVEFMRQYFNEHHHPVELADSLQDLILGTEHTHAFVRSDFSDDRNYMLGQIVTTADLMGQMADRIYPEKLLFLYMEFKEANLGHYQNMRDILCQTTTFFDATKKKLAGPLGGMHKRFKFHFQATLGVDKDFYMEAIENNIAYVSKVISLDEAEYLSMLKRNGIVARIRALTVPD